MFACDLPSACIVVVCLGGRVLEPHYTKQQKGPGDPWSAGPTQSKQELLDGEEGPGMPFGVMHPLSWKPTREGVTLPPLLDAEEGSNNKNTG